jgi:hypothetical protein
MTGAFRQHYKFEKKTGTAADFRASISAADVASFSLASLQAEARPPKLCLYVRRQNSCRAYLPQAGWFDSD